MKVYWKLDALGSRKAKDGTPGHVTDKKKECKTITGAWAILSRDKFERPERVD